MLYQLSYFRMMDNSSLNCECKYTVKFSFCKFFVKKSGKESKIPSQRLSLHLMEKMIHTLCALGEQLRAMPEAVVARAMAENPWFTPASIRAAVEAICDQMLRREQLAAWLKPYAVPVSEPKRVLIILAGNLPLVGFFDLLCVVMSGHRCLVKPSSKDRVLICYVVDCLRALDAQIPIELYDGTTPPDAVIATGSDNTNRYFKARYGMLPTLLRGSRQSVAVLTGEECAEELRGLEEDIWLHHGLGCRNVSLLFLKKGMEFPALQPQALHEKYRNNYLQTKALLQMTGQPFIDLQGAVAICQTDFPNALSALSYTYYETLAEVEAWLRAHDRELQCVVARSVAHPRRVDFGAAQHPRLTDYPDAVDVVAFLERI